MRAVVLIILALTVAQVAMSNDVGVISCRRRILTSCRPNGRVCMRFSRTNLCEYFRDNCQQLLASCNRGGVTQAFYEKVNVKYCRGMPMNQRLPCGYRTNNNNKVNRTRVVFG